MKKYKPSISPEGETQVLTFDDLPTTTVHQARLQVYEPTRRPKKSRREIITSWGTAVINGKLGQGHADVVEAVFKEAMDWKFLDDGRIQVLVDPYKVRITANGGKQGSHQQLNKVLLEIMTVVLELDIPARNIKIIGSHIFEEVVQSNHLVKGPGFTKKGGNFQNELRPMWRVTISGAYVKLIGEDLHLHYDPTPIAALANGISQAVARHIASHRQQPPGGWYVDGLIRAVGEGLNSTAMRNRRRELLLDLDGLKKIGLSIEEGRIKRLE